MNDLSVDTIVLHLAHQGFPTYNLTPTSIRDQGAGGAGRYHCQKARGYLSMIPLVDFVDQLLGCFDHNWGL